MSAKLQHHQALSGKNAGAGKLQVPVRKPTGHEAEEPKKRRNKPSKGKKRNQKKANIGRPFLHINANGSTAPGQTTKTAASAATGELRAEASHVTYAVSAGAHPTTTTSSSSSSSSCRDFSKNAAPARSTSSAGQGHHLLRSLLTPTAERRGKIEDAMEQLQTLVVGHLGLDFYLKPQGSYAQNLLLPDSDLDLVLCHTDEKVASRTKSVKWLQQLAAFFRNARKKQAKKRQSSEKKGHRSDIIFNGEDDSTSSGSATTTTCGFRLCECIFSARIPILKLNYLEDLEIDISAGDDRRGTVDETIDRTLTCMEAEVILKSPGLKQNDLLAHGGRSLHEKLTSAAILQHAGSTSCSSRDFLKFLKAFASESELNVAWDRGLSNFSWVLLGMYFLQNVKATVGASAPMNNSENVDSADILHLWDNFLNWFCSTLQDYVASDKWLVVDVDLERSAFFAGNKPRHRSSCSSSQAAQRTSKARSVYDPVLGTIVTSYEDDENGGEEHNFNRGGVNRNGNRGPSHLHDASPLRLQVPHAEFGENAARCLSSAVWEKKIVPAVRTARLEMQRWLRTINGSCSASTAISSRAATTKISPSRGQQDHARHWWVRFVPSLAADLLGRDSTTPSCAGDSTSLAQVDLSSAAKTSNRTTGTSTTSSSSSSSASNVTTTRTAASRATTSIAIASLNTTTSTSAHYKGLSETSESSDDEMGADLMHMKQFCARKITAGGEEEDSEKQDHSDGDVAGSDTGAARAVDNEMSEDQDDDEDDDDEEPQHVVDKRRREKAKNRERQSGKRMLYGDTRLLAARNLLSKKPPPAQDQSATAKRVKKKKMLRKKQKNKKLDRPKIKKKR
ncbi:unnamed protein product [Amoebophrya sp. A120]|nr:unnamed protein product [Amoebophrya sp. A120]|eukprot:GSA120T00001349001.1